MTNRVVTHGRSRLFPRSSARPQNSVESGRETRLAELEIENTRLRLQIEQLQKSEAQNQTSFESLRAFYQRIPIGYVTIDDKGVLMEWNEVAGELLDAKKCCL